jgi:hypothetical protein
MATFERLRFSRPLIKCFKADWTLFLTILRKKFEFLLEDIELHSHGRIILFSLLHHVEDEPLPSLIFTWDGQILDGIDAEDLLVHVRCNRVWQQRPTGLVQMKKHPSDLLHFSCVCLVELELRGTLCSIMWLIPKLAQH